MLMDERESYNRLEALDLNARLQAVADDVESRRDEFRTIEPHDLAELLEVPSSRSPGEGWSFTSYVPRIPLAEYVEYNSPDYDVINYLDGKIDQARFDRLNDEAIKVEEGKKEKFDLSLLTSDEQRLIEDSIMDKTLRMTDGPRVIANYILNVPGSDRSMSFEGYIEDDGGCIDLLTPYDERDGKFQDLSDSAVESY
jgi:hypothetical protein